MRVILTIAALLSFTLPARRAHAEAASGVSCPYISSDVPVLGELNKRVVAIQTGGENQTKYLGNFRGVNYVTRELAKLEQQVNTYCQKPNPNDAKTLGDTLTQVGKFITDQDPNFKYIQEHSAKVVRALHAFGNASADSCGSDLQKFYQQYAPAQDQNRQKQNQLAQKLQGCGAAK
jgi:hypothetical protein